MKASLLPYVMPKSNDLKRRLKDISERVQPSERVMFAFGCNIRVKSLFGFLSHAGAYAPCLLVWTSDRVILSNLSEPAQQCISVDHSQILEKATQRELGRIDLYKIWLKARHDSYEFRVAITNNELNFREDFVEHFGPAASMEERPTGAIKRSLLWSLVRWDRGLYSIDELPFVVELRVRNALLGFCFSFLLTMAVLDGYGSFKLRVLNAAFLIFYPSTMVGIFYPKWALGAEKTHLSRTGFEKAMGIFLILVGIVCSGIFAYRVFPEIKDHLTAIRQMAS